MAWEWFDGKWMTSEEADHRRGGQAALVIVVGICAGLYYGLRTGIKFVCSWQEYEAPLRQVAAWYYFGLYIPAKYLLLSVVAPWSYIYGNVCKDYPNLNLVLAIIAIGVVVALLCVVIAALFRRWGRAIAWFLSVVWGGPLVFLAIWALCRWLLSK